MGDAHFGGLGSAEPSRGFLKRPTSATRERRCAAIEAALKKTPRMRDRDQKIVARHLHDLLEEFQKYTGRKKEEVLRALNIGGSGDSTKQLYNYTLPPDGETEKRKLTQLTHKYRLIAEKAAEIADWNRKETLIGLFHGSSYDDSTQAFDSLPEEYLFTMYDILDRMKNWLLRNSDIEWYFKTLQEKFVMDYLGNLFIVGAPNGFNDYDKAIPGVPLYRILGSEFDIEFAPRSNPVHAVGRQRRQSMGQRPKAPGNRSSAAYDVLRARSERPRGCAAERGKECPSSDVACHVALRLGVIHAMEG
jgi:hypothetical protein